MLCLTLMVILLDGVLRSVVAVNCPGLPVIDNGFQIGFRNLVASSVGEDPNSVTVTIESGPFFTCQVQGTSNGTYQKVSLIVTYSSNQGHNNAVGQFEMECIDLGGGNRQWDTVSNSLSTPGVHYTTISPRTDCSDCVTNSPPNENHCQPCNSACNTTGLMRCTGTGSDDCCAAFENDMCIPTPNCTQPNFVANEQNNYNCSCEILTNPCNAGFMPDFTSCTCILTNICLTQLHTCVNGGVCVLVSPPDNFTCNCTGTGFTGDNCDVPITSTASSTASSTSSASSPTPSQVPSQTSSSTSVSMRIRTSSMSATPDGSPTQDTAISDKNELFIPVIVISIIIGLLVLIILVVAILYTIYYFLSKNGFAMAKAKNNAPFANGEAHDNPLYLKPDVVTSEVDKLFPGDS